MITQVKLVNFQSHKKTIIDLSDGLNFLTGPTDNGKSVIVRALDAVINNNISDSDVNNDIPRNKANTPKGNTEITITTDKGTVKRVKGKDNYYEINDKKLTAFNRSVPDEVIEFFNLSDLNVQNQENNYFLLNETNGKVAQYLNKIVNLDIIDTTLSNVNKKLRAINKKREAKKDEQEELSIQLKQFDFIEDLEIMIAELESKEHEKTELETKLNNIKMIINNIRSIREELEQYGILDASETVAGLLIIYDECERLKDTLNKLSILLEDYRKARNSLKLFNDVIQHEETVNDLLYKVECKNQLECDYSKLSGIIDGYNTTLKGLDNTIGSVNIDKELELLSEYKDRKTYYDNMNNFIDSYKGLEKKIKVQKRGVKLKEREYNKIKPDDCPLCGGVM